MINYDKTEIKNQMTDDQIFDLLQEFGGDPEWAEFGIISSTICHNPPGEGSRKLYYYSNSGLLTCYTGCGNSFDIFELVIKVANIQFHKDYDLNDAVRYVAYKFGISGEETSDEDKLQDWEALGNYERIQDIELKNLNVELKEYDGSILNFFNYDVAITPWLEEGITREAMRYARIGYYPGLNQITIPHFDINNRFIGLRGRTIIEEDAERYGKYRPIKINQLLYNHPLGMNLYNLNNSKNNIKTMQKAIVYESEVRSSSLYR